MRARKTTLKDLYNNPLLFFLASIRERYFNIRNLKQVQKVPVSYILAFLKDNSTFQQNINILIFNSNDHHPSFIFNVLSVYFYFHRINNIRITQDFIVVYISIIYILLRCKLTPLAQASLNFNLPSSLSSSFLFRQGV